MIKSIFLGALLFSANVFAIAEKNYAKEWKEKVLPFFDTGEKIEIVTDQNVRIVGRYFKHETAQSTVLLLTGWSETIIKYAELIYDLHQKGYDVIAYDHRGQGLSTHLVPKNPQISYVDHFSDYVHDLERFVSAVVLSKKKKKLFLLAHSMGGTIASFYLSHHHDVFDAAVLNAPMWEINTKPYPKAIAYNLLKGLRAMGKKRNYAPGKGDYDPHITFNENILTTSPERFWMSKRVNELFSETIIGGPSVNWVYESLKATRKMKKIIPNISTPFLVFQAIDDQVVKIKRQSTFCLANKFCKLQTFPKAQHEILMEQDLIRDKAISRLHEFFLAYP